MVRRLSVARLDSGAESPVYGAESSASADRRDPVAGPPRSGGGGRWAAWPMRDVESVAALPIARQAGSGATAQNALANRLPAFLRAFASGDQAAPDRCLAPGASVSELSGAVSFGGITSLQVPQGGSTRDIAVTVNWMLPVQVSTAAPRLAVTYDMSVVDQQSGRWYVKDIRASTQPTGTP